MNAVIASTPWTIESVWRRRHAGTYVVAVLAICSSAHAQNISGVFGPEIEADHKSLECRIGFDPDTGNVAHRLHAQASLSDAWMLRVIAQSRETATSDLDFDLLGVQLFWQMTPDNQDWQSGLRLDARLRDEGRPATVRLDWSNQFRLAERRRIRAVALGTAEMGDTSRSGVFLQTRGQLAYQIDGKRSLGLEVYSDYGSTDDLRAASEQNQQAGPFATIDVAKDWSLTTEVLLGLTDSSPQTNLKLAMTRQFWGHPTALTDSGLQQSRK